MSQMVRVVLVPADTDEETAAAQQIIVDMQIDPNTGESPGPFPAFGRIGDFNRPATLYPFTLMKDGRMDFGAHATDAQREDMFDIRDARIAEGESIPYRSGNDTRTFVVKTVTPLVK